ncbi:sensor histidine kinase [Actinomycetospora cinnamomea]|uniref:Sensor-like histidine kinase SenX3 n=1 Tax=Actinomycetospora cinnamomea TaxID=663609 RepID=A0A2U1FIB2_9PSEU|nr:ATP-binding protein [Actinomycetospora cinnamomea]PVZ11922.1 histidine kinase/DNA gyrase B/HSP90-like ATPase [Actinomycetospora cinnamomea]
MSLQAALARTLHRAPLALRHGLVLLVAGTGYAVAALTALSWFDPNGVGPSFFPAAGWSVALLCVLERRWWPAVLAGVAAAEVAVDLAAGLSVAAAVGFAVANTVEPALGATLARARAGGRPDLSRQRDLTGFVAGAVVAAPLAGALIGALVDTVVGAGRPWHEFVARWWLGDGLAVLVVATAVVAVLTLPWDRRTVLATAAAAGVGAGATAALFWTQTLVVVYVPALLLVWVALRYGVGAVSVVGLAAALTAAQGEAEGLGFGATLGVAPGVSHVYLQMLLAVLLLTVMLLAVRVDEQVRAKVAAEIAARRSADLAAWNAELERSNAELDTFAYAASHDLREPLRAIAQTAGFVLEDAADLDDESTRRLRSICLLAIRMDELLDSLLRYSQVGRGELDPVTVDLDGVLDEVAALLAERCREAGVELRREGRLPVVRGDRAQLGEVLTNLLVNAIKYAGDEPRWVEVGPGPVPEGSAATDCAVYVRDNGVGIPPERREDVFAPFQRLHPGRARGLGMGLAISRKIIERHGGRIGVESTPGQGSSFWFTVPSAGVPSQQAKIPRSTTWNMARSTGLNT